MNQNKHEYWQQQISLCQNSDKTAKEYCRENKLSYWNFMCWKKKLRTDPDIEIPLVKVADHPETNNRDADAGIECIITEKIILRLSNDYHSETLKRLLSDFGVSR